jgi:hypothetical protein
MVAVSEATIHPEEAGPMAQQMSVLGIDIATLVFHGVGRDDTGHVVLRKRLARREWLHDARDAEAICEAMSRPTRRFVPIKQPEPQDPPGPASGPGAAHEGPHGPGP